MDRASIGDLHKTPTLSLGQISFKRKRTSDPLDSAVFRGTLRSIIRVHPVVMQSHLDIVECQL